VRLRSRTPIKSASPTARTSALARLTRACVLPEASTNSTSRPSGAWRSTTAPRSPRRKPCSVWVASRRTVQAERRRKQRRGNDTVLRPTSGERRESETTARGVADEPERTNTVRPEPVARFIGKLECDGEWCRNAHRAELPQRTIKATRPVSTECPESTRDFRPVRSLLTCRANWAGVRPIWRLKWRPK
jgi:hypothetical protein